MKVEIYSDVACPWCYVGKARFERALAEHGGAGETEVAYRPYQLDPGAPMRGVALLEYLEERFGETAGSMAEQVTRSAAGEGLVMDFDRALAANTFDAHRLMWLAEREFGMSTQHEVAEALFRAHFADGSDVADRSVLLRLAAESGINEGRAAEVLDGDAGVREVRDQIAHARRLGITAVPTFVFDGRYAVQGAQPAAVFRRAFEAVSSRAPEDGDPGG